MVIQKDKQKTCNVNCRFFYGIFVLFFLLFNQFSAQSQQLQF